LWAQGSDSRRLIVLFLTARPVRSGASCMGR
jgi:hypothetical protein